MREPWRVAVAALLRAGAGDLLEDLPMAAQVPAETLRTVARLAARPGWPLASGAGRVFEAAGALLGLAAVNGYEGEAAARLEALAGVRLASRAVAGARVRAPDPGPRTPAVLGAAGGRGAPPARRRAAGARRGGLPRDVLPARGAVDERAWRRTAPRRWPSAAGAWSTACCREALVTELAAQGLDTLLPFEVPPGDGGIAYGQAVLGVVGESLGGS